MYIPYAIMKKKKENKKPNEYRFHYNEYPNSISLFMNLF